MPAALESFASQVHQRAVPDRAIQITGQRSGNLEVVSLLPDPQQRALHDLLGCLSAAEHARCQGAQAIVVLPENRLERRLIAKAKCSDKRGGGGGRIPRTQLASQTSMGHTASSNSRSSVVTR
jgi:hypothetical protein